MNKILIVGHPQSDYEEVETLLNGCGMASAQPSRREGYLPQQISATLCKVHNAVTLQHIEAGAEVKQIETGPVWHGMAMDLMLGNLDQPFWGWSDPQSIFLLDYWLSLDPAITFVLAYDKPQSVLTRLDASAAADLNPQALQQRVQGWTAFNAALLHFFLRHPQRCLLVHTQQVRESAASYLQQMRSRIDAPWSDGVAHDQAALKEADCRPITPQSPVPDALSALLADALLSQHSTSLQLYEELQAYANLPMGKEVSLTIPAAFEAWRSMIARQLEIQTQSLQFDNLKQTSQALQIRLDKAESLGQKTQALVKQLEDSCQRSEQLAQERQQLLDEQTRLHTVESHDYQQRLTELEAVRDVLEARQQDTSEENELLLIQLHQVQEELEHYYMDGQQKGKLLDALQKAEASLSKIAADQEKQLAEKQKQLNQQQAQFQTSEKDVARRLQKLQAEVDTERVKASEMRSELLRENELLVNQLHQVQEELERYYLESQQLKKKLALAKQVEHVYYGAGDRIRQQLSYKLGTTMIENSRSMSGWLQIPVKMIFLALQHKRELPRRQAQKLPPIHKYRDANEADRHRNHLSYRLGQILLKNIRNPIGWIQLPMAIRREVHDFRNRQQQI